MKKQKKHTLYTIKRIISYVQCSKQIIFILGIGVIIASIVTFMRPQIVSKLTDEGLTAGDFSIVIFWCGCLFFVSMLEYANELVQIRVFARMSNQFVQNLFQAALEKILKAPYSYSQTRTATEMFNTISNDISRISLLIDRNSLMILRYGFQILDGTIGLFLLDWRLAIMVLLVIPLKQIVIIWMSKCKTILTDSYIKE